MVTPPTRNVFFDDETHINKIPVGLSGVAETLFIPLAARAWDARSSNPVLGDSIAGPVVDRLEYDFTKVLDTPTSCQVMAIRTLNFDRWVASFLQQYQDAMVINLGCGLDSRARRLGPGDGVIWIDADLPEVIELRQRVMSDMLPTCEYKTLAVDATIPGWLDALPQDRPTAVVMEGFLSYLSEESSRAVLGQLVDHFGQGEIFLECLSPTMLAQVQNSKLKNRWKIQVDLKSAVSNVKDLEQIGSLKVLEAFSFYSAPGVERLPWISRAQMYVCSWIPGVKDFVRLVRLGWGNDI